MNVGIFIPPGRGKAIPLSRRKAGYVYGAIRNEIRLCLKMRGQVSATDLSCSRKAASDHLAHLAKTGEIRKMQSGTIGRNGKPAIYKTV